MAERRQARLSLLDCVAIGVNGIVGSGIFLLPGRMAAEAGPASILAFLGCGLICQLIALCFAEAAGTFDRSGGAFLYGRVAFGETVGFAIGWMSLCEGVVGYAAGARGLASQVGALVPALGSGFAQGALAAALVLTLGAINIAGLKKGAHTSDLFSIAKLLPILAVAALGLAHLSSARLQPFFSGGGNGLSRAIFTAVFACSGFEYVAVPAGEAGDARSDVPRAIVGALGGATVLYAVVQLALVGSTSISGSAQPLAEAAAQLAGPWGAKAILVAGVVSMAGFCASSALVGPRLFVAFAEDGLLPSAVRAMHPRLGTPVLAVVLGAGSSALAAAALPFDRLVDFSNVALFAQYLPTCLAVMVLRRTRPELPRRFRLPGGDAIPVLALCASVAMLAMAHPEAQEWIWSGIVLAVGFAFLFVHRRLRGAALPPTAP